MSTNEAISRNLAEIQAIQKDNLLYHKSRLVTTSNRVAIVGNVIQNDSNDAINTTSSQAIESFLVTLEEIKDYLYLFTSKTQSLANRIILYGSDEEQFIKWGERLQHCVALLGKSDKLVGVFDPEQDLHDFQADVVHLKSSLVNIITLLVSNETNAIPTSLKHSLEFLLDHQSDIRSTYQTKNAPTAALEIDPKKIKYEKIIGRGGEYVAIKTIPLALLTKQSSEALKTEANIMRRLAHPRIVGCYGIFEHEDNQCIVMELMDSGSLHDYIYEKPCPEGWLKREEIAFDICSGMSYLHRLNVIHRDLKPGNVVMDEFLRAKITDFGLSVVKNTAVTSIKGSEQGTIQYMGIQLQEIRDGIRSKERLEISPSTPKLISKMIESCWDPNPKARPDFNSLAKCLEENIISIQISFTRAFTSTVTGEAINNFEKSNYASIIPDSKIDNNQKNASAKTAKGQKRRILPDLRAIPSKRKYLILVICVIVVVTVVGVVIAVSLSSRNDSANVNVVQATPTPTLSTASTTYNVSSLTAVLNVPYGIASDASGNLYVANTNSHKIIRITKAGAIDTIAGNGAPGFSDGQKQSALLNFPRGIVYDPAGNFFVADAENSNIRKVTLNGSVNTVAGNGSYGGSDGQGRAAYFFRPSAITIDSQGNLFVADTYNHKIRKINTTGYVSTISGRGFTGSVDTQGVIASYSYPQGITIDAAGNLLVADTSNNVIKKLAPSGLVTTIAGNGSAGSTDGPANLATFNGPVGIVFDPDGNLIVSDVKNNLIRKIDSSGYVTTIAGKVSAGLSDGIGSSAAFNQPRGITFDPSGFLYIADSQNNKVRKIAITKNN